jgi:transcriptional regulator with XRE-family HTH domain
MSFGGRLTEVRKKRGFSQEELADLLGTKGPAIGRYERGVAKPTIEVAGRLAKILGVSLDYLVGNSDQEMDSKTQKLIIDVQNLPQDIKEKVFYFIDISIKDHKTRQAYSA